ncbi:MAG: hypothetical protein ACI4S4_02530, partial [Candidatus Ornithospirochaeta sp.]
MKRITRIMTLFLVVMLSLSFIVSCSSEKAMDGSSKETKKVMTGEDYSRNSDAIRGLALSEAYVAVMADESKPLSRSTAVSGTYEYEFSSEDTVSTAKVREKLEEAASRAETPEEAKKYYNALLASLPKEELTLSFEKG